MFSRRCARWSGTHIFCTIPVRVLTYECDALSHLRQTPARRRAAGDRRTRSRRSSRFAADASVPFVARGHGTGLSGGATPLSGRRADRALAPQSRPRRGHPQSARHRRAGRDQPRRSRGRSRRSGYYYAPDPSSQQVCSIGGNVAENSGGAHCLKYGFTVHHVLGASKSCCPTASSSRSAASSPTRPVPDLLGAVHRLRRHARRRHASDGPHPAAPGGGADAACRPSTPSTRRALAVSEIIRARIVPAAVEMMDALTIEAAEAAVHPDFPAGRRRPHRRARRSRRGSATTLFATVERSAARRAPRISRSRATTCTARASGRAARPRLRRWAACRPTTTSRTASCRGPKLPEVLRAHPRARSALGPAHRQRLPRGRRQPASAHLLRRARSRDRPSRPSASPSEILTYCLDAGGSLTGEHGVGVDKNASHAARCSRADDLDTMQRVRCAFDPRGLCNPARFSRRRASAARCRARTARIRSSGPGWPSGSDGAPCSGGHRRRPARASCATRWRIATRSTAWCRPSSSSPSRRGRGRHAGLGGARRACDGASRRRHQDGWGRRPAGVDVLLSLHGVDRVLSHRGRRPDRDRRGRRAGWPTSIAVLGAHGQWLPLDPPCERRCDDWRTARDQ